jgi:hypothetical protein
MSLGHHLRSQQNLKTALSEIRQNFFSAVFPGNTVQIESPV